MSAKLPKWIGIWFIVLLVNTAYVAAFATPSVFYMSNVLLHLGLGLALSIGLVFLLRRDSALRHSIATTVGLFAIALAFGLFLVAAGNVTENRWAFWAHIGAAGLGLAFLIPYVWQRAQS